MIEEIKQFRTADGSTFNYLDEAEKYNLLLKQCDEIENVLVSRPDDIDFANGVGWLQHPDKTKKELEENIVNLYNSWFKNNHASRLNYVVGRTIDDNDIKCLNHLMYRWQCISNDNREYGQPYYASNAYMATGGQIN